MRYPRAIWILVILLAAVSWWLGSGDPPHEVPVVTETPPREVDYFVRGLDATEMNLAGRPARTLNAGELRHFPADDTTELLQPRLTVYQQDGPPWVILSDTGWVSSDGSLILLKGEVHITREAGEFNRPVQLDTHNLRVQPHQDYAETDEKVRVRSERDWVNATGMQAWFRSPARIKLLANVKGHYVPL